MSALDESAVFRHPLYRHVENPGDYGRAAIVSIHGPADHFHAFKRQGPISPISNAARVRSMNLNAIGITGGFIAEALGGAA